MTRTYEFSGAVPIFGFFSTLISSISLAVILAVIYAIAQYWMPLIYFCILFTIGFTAILGMGTGMAARAGHVRSVWLVVLLGFLAGVLGMYITWGTHLLLNVDRGGLENWFVAYRPESILQWIQVGYEKGFWGIGRGGGNVSGVFAAIVWLIEFGLVTIGSAVMAYGAFVESPYCETCGRWSKLESGVAKCQLLSVEELSTLLEEGRSVELRKLAPPTDPDAPHLRFDLSVCEACDDFNAVTVKKVEISYDDKKERSESTTDLLDKVLITFEQSEDVRAIGSEVDPPLAEAAESAPTPA